MDPQTKDRVQTWVVVLIIMTLMALSLRSWWRQPSFSDSGKRPVMGTLAHIIAVAENLEKANTAISAAFEEVYMLEKIFSVHNPDSQLSALNSEAFPGPFYASGQLYSLIEKSVRYSAVTGGTFDITVAPIVDLWNQAKDQGQPPSDEQLKAVRQMTGYNKLLLNPDKQTVTFKVPGMKLDLGAIAKGYAVDRAVEVMKENGATGGLVDIGGEIRTFGKPPTKNKKWKLGIQDPGEEEQLLTSIMMDDTAVATSGDYRRYFTIDGVNYSHILNPINASAASELTSVTIIAPTCTKADALATAVTVMGLEKGLELIESLPETEALMVVAQTGEIIKTSGFDKYMP